MDKNSDKVCYLMRGLPSCGKSTFAKTLVGSTGIVLETDDYYYSQIGEPDSYDYDPKLYSTAQQWCFEKFRKAVNEGVTPIVVDRGNSLSLESKAYALFAKVNGYDVHLTEPETPWWQEIRILLKYKKYNLPVLKRWAVWLAQMSQSTHRVPVKTIWYWMLRWQHQVSIEDIIAFVPQPSSKDKKGVEGQPIKHYQMDVNNEEIDQGLDFYKVDLSKYLADSLGIEDDDFEEDIELDELIANQAGWKIVEPD